VIIVYIRIIKEILVGEIPAASTAAAILFVRKAF